METGPMDVQAPDAAPEDRSDDAPAPATPTSAPPPLPKRFEATLDLAFIGVQGIPAAGSNVAPEGHCAIVTIPSKMDVLALAATATWAPQSALVEELRLRIYSPEDFDVHADATGPSPLEAATVEAAGYEEVWFALHAADPSAAVDQKATLEVRIDYIGSGEPELETSPCWHPDG